MLTCCQGIVAKGIANKANAALESAGNPQKREYAAFPRVE